MQINQLEDLLQDVGLSEREAQIYLAALSLGSSTVKQIAATSGINRTTSYTVIESLEKKGLMSIETSGFKRLFTAENPERLEQLIEQKRETLQRGLPELASLYQHHGKESVIRYHRSLDGLKAVYNEILDGVKAGDYYFVIGHTDLLLDIEKDYFSEFLKKRGKLYSDIRLFLRDTPLVRQYLKQEPVYNFKIKLLSEEMSLQSVLIITPKKAIIHQLVLPFETLVIENRSVITLLTSVYEYFWGQVE